VELRHGGKWVVKINGLGNQKKLEIHWHPATGMEIHTHSKWQLLTQKDGHMLLNGQSSLQIEPLITSMSLSWFCSCSAATWNVTCGGSWEGDTASWCYFCGSIIISKSKVNTTAKREPTEWFHCYSSRVGLAQCDTSCSKEWFSQLAASWTFLVLSPFLPVLSVKDDRRNWSVDSSCTCPRSPTLSGIGVAHLL
jgi:hypothetical protein